MSKCEVLLWIPWLNFTFFYLLILNVYIILQLKFRKLFHEYLTRILPIFMQLNVYIILKLDLLKIVNQYFNWILCVSWTSLYRPTLVLSVNCLRLFIPWLNFTCFMKSNVYTYYLKSSMHTLNVLYVCYELECVCVTYFNIWCLLRHW